MEKAKLTNINTYLMVALVVVVAIGLYFTLSVPKIEPPKLVPPREITLTVLGTDCEGCFNITAAVDFIKQQKNLNVTATTELSIADSAEKVGTYGITKLPALVITGNVTNLTIPNFDAKENALVFDKAPAPFYNVAEKRVVGKVTVIQLEDKTCPDCFNLSQITAQLSQAGIKLESQKTVDAKSEEGKGLIAKYKIEKVPSLIFNSDALEYDVIKEVWDQVGSKESDGSLVLRFVNPPYVNVSTGKVEGLVQLTALVDKSCTDCFNISVLKVLLGEGFSMAFAKDETVDVSSAKGKMLVKKYSIDLIPTVVLSKEVSVYPNFAEAWTQVGSIETDGSAVFTKVEILKEYFGQQGTAMVYKNLTSGQIINGSAAPEEPEAEIAPPAAEQ